MLALLIGLTARATERPFSFNLRGGRNVPTFDIADAADPGAGFGAGALNFAVDVPGADSFTCFAIHAGGEVGDWLNDHLSVFFSPQGDIAFSDEEELGTGDAWVRPFTAGIEIRP